MTPPTGTEARVCADIARRQELGLQKYGLTVEANPLSLRQWLQHAYEEHLDAAVYLRRAIEEIDAQVIREREWTDEDERTQKALELYAELKDRRP